MADIGARSVNDRRREERGNEEGEEENDEKPLENDETVVTGWRGMMIRSGIRDGGRDGQRCLRLRDQGWTRQGPVILRSSSLAATGDDLIVRTAGPCQLVGFGLRGLWAVMKGPGWRAGETMLAD